MSNRPVPGPSTITTPQSSQHQSQNGVTASPWTTSPSTSTRTLPRSQRAPSIMSTYSTTETLSPSTQFGSVGQGYPSRRGFTSNLRKISSNSASGTSTPDYKKRARKMVEKGLIKEGEGDRDWANVEPDDVFRRLPVNEVKKVEAKMRKEALDKQTDLRSMVGARYRDLLTSATQISSLRSSSLTLASSLRSVADACANPGDVAMTAETSTQVSENEEDITAKLPLAGHMKLLLDAPEVLYTYLAEGEVLKAGWLWLVGRVVREGINALGEQSEVYQPLLQRQWEILVPFRTQIVQRATDKLRSKDNLDSKDLAEALLTIILLDNAAVPEVLSLLLSQRIQALKEILVHPNPAQKARRASVQSRSRRRTLSKSTRPEHDQEAITRVFTLAIQCVLQTLDSARAVFEPSTSSGGKESLIEEMVRLVQVGEPAPQVTTQPIPIRRTSSSSNHTRRASRLVSLSLPVAPSISTSTGSAPIVTPQIIQSLPSSQILLRHLPQAILAFTPFISPPQSPNLAEQLEGFLADGIRLLTDSAPNWLVDVHSVQSVWAVRKRLSGEMSDSDHEKRLQDAMEEQWMQRIRGVWEMRMLEVVETLRREVTDAVHAMRDNPKQTDINPERFVFSDMSFPVVPSSTLSTVAPISIATFSANLKKRSIYRTPLLDRVLSELEYLAGSLKEDMRDLPSNLVAVYRQIANTTFGDVVTVLEGVLETISTEPVETDSTKADAAAEKETARVRSQLLLGRIALFLAKHSSFLQDLVGESSLSTDSTVSSLLSLHSRSTDLWQTTSITSALTLLAPLFDRSITPSEVKANWQHPFPLSPSASLMVSLKSLVGAVRLLGLAAGSDLTVVQQLVTRYVGQVEGLDGWKGLEEEKCVQAAVDLGFLALINGEDVLTSEAVKGMLEKIPSSVPSDFPSLLPQILADYLRRTQIILHPLIIHLQPSLPGLGDIATPQQAMKGRPAMDSRSQLLRFGPPGGKAIESSILHRPGPDGELPENGAAATAVVPTETGTEFRSPFAVMKPGKRFGLVN